MTRILLVLLFALGVRAAELKLGKPLILSQATTIKDLTADPEGYVGKSVQVKGKITEVCQVMGCWMMLIDGAGSRVRIKVNDGEIAFPKDAAGREAVAEGELVKFDLTRDQAIEVAKHEAYERGRKFDPSSVKGPIVIYQIQGSGAVLFD